MGSMPKASRDKFDLLMLSSMPKRGVAIALGIALILISIAIILLSALHNSASCKNVILGSDRQACYFALAQSSGNITYCKYAGSNVPSCIQDAVASQNTISKCSSISYNYSYYADCVEAIAYKTKTFSFCSSLNSAYNSSCYFEVARMDNFSSALYCGAIENHTYGAYCYDGYYANLAILSHNTSYCEHLPSIENQTISSMLYSNLNYTQRNDTSYLSYYGLSPMALCDYYASAKNQSANSNSYTINAGAINSISNSSFNITSPSQLCGYAKASNYSSAANTTLKTLCLYYIYTSRAISSRNLSECSQIGNVSLYDNCAAQLAYKYNNATYCMNIANSNDKSACEYQAGLNVTYNSTYNNT